MRWKTSIAILLSIDWFQNMGPSSKHVHKLLIPFQPCALAVVFCAIFQANTWKRAGIDPDPEPVEGRRRQVRKTSSKDVLIPSLWSKSRRPRPQSLQSPLLSSLTFFCRPPQEPASFLTFHAAGSFTSHHLCTTTWNIHLLVLSSVCYWALQEPPFIMQSCS